MNRRNLTEYYVLLYVIKPTKVRPLQQNFVKTNMIYLPTSSIYINFAENFMAINKTETIHRR